MFQEHRTKPAVCPGCGETLDAATGVTDRDPPSEGDFTVCLYCAMVLRFDSESAVRAASQDELRKIALEDPRAFHLLARVVYSVKEVKANRKEGEGT